jgi:DNA-directed RNA polymerase subunit RPC12/RpoP
MGKAKSNITGYYKCYSCGKEEFNLAPMETEHDIICTNCGMTQDITAELGDGE